MPIRCASIPWKRSDFLALILRLAPCVSSGLRNRWHCTLPFSHLHRSRLHDLQVLESRTSWRSTVACRAAAAGLQKSPIAVNSKQNTAWQSQGGKYGTAVALWNRGSVQKQRCHMCHPQHLCFAKPWCGGTSLSRTRFFEDSSINRSTAKQAIMTSKTWCKVF